MQPRVVWVFSSIRCGSSITAYSAAAPWGHAVADEVFGPWVRMGPPYNYPPPQKRLRNLFRDAGDKITPEVIQVANRLFRKLGEKTGTVVNKHPHASIDPAHLAEYFPDHKSVFLLRNPLHRLNSLYARGWSWAMRGGFDMDVYKLAARRWLAHPHRIAFDELKRDPRAFYRKIWDAWGWSYTESNVTAAAEYRQSHYHESSKEEGEGDPNQVMSETRKALPREAVMAYLNDPFIRGLMEQVGWETDPEAYLTSCTDTSPERSEGCGQPEVEGRSLRSRLVVPTSPEAAS